MMDFNPKTTDAGEVVRAARDDAETDVGEMGGGLNEILERLLVVNQGWMIAGVSGGDILREFNILLYLHEYNRAVLIKLWKATAEKVEED